MRAAQGRATKSLERIEADKRRNEEVQETLALATPVPQSFEQAVSWACTASIAAAEAGNMRQSMYFSAAGGEDDVSGDIGSVLPFAESFSKALVQQEALEGGTVTALFTDMGAAAMCTNRWQPLPEGLKVEYFPPILRGAQISAEERMKFTEILKSEYVLVVAPTQNELPALLLLLKTMEETGKDVPIVVFNAKFVQSTYIAQGTLLKSARELEKTLVPTFHLEQYDPPEEETTLNPAVITRVWPRPFSLWEDNPDDPDAVEGFFLLDVRDDSAHNEDTVKEFLKASIDIAQKWAEREKQRRLE